MKDLTPLQQALVRYMHENDCSPHDAVAAGVCSSASVEKWRIGHIHTWLQEYRASLPPDAQELARQATHSLNAMLGNALRVVADTLATGEGNATAVKTAQWVLEGIKAQAAAAPDPSYRTGFEPVEAAELAAVLKLVGD